MMFNPEKIDPQNPGHSLGMTAKLLAQNVHKWAKEVADSVKSGEEHEDLKISLPEGNHAAAFVLGEVDGINEIYVALSGLNSDTEFTILNPPQELVGLTIPPEFEVKNVNNRNEEREQENAEYYPRIFDCEAKILEKINKDLNKNVLEPHSVELDIYIYTYIEPCISCEFVTNQFLDKYDKITIHYYYDVPFSTSRRRRAQRNAQPQ